jgi:hypothetical protein
MKCPHCGIAFHDEWTHPWQGAGDVQYSTFRVAYTQCPACKKTTLTLEKLNRNGMSQGEVMFHPRGVMRPIPGEVPQPYSIDYQEAVEVLPISPKASAALSRRNLQAILRDVLKVKKADLSLEIKEFIERPSTPAQLGEVVDAVRNLGNFASHPIKNTTTGLLVEVEPGEAEWLLDVLDALFDFCFVQPARNQARKAALNTKLQQTGKPPMR